MERKHLQTENECDDILQFQRMKINEVTMQMLEMT